MHIFSRSLPVNHRLFKASDLHLGSRACHLDGWYGMIERVGTEKNTYLSLGGDLIEAITVDDKRFEPDIADLSEGIMTPMKQAKRIIKDLMPIRKKILFILLGNHEAKLLRIGDLSAFICHELGVVYGTYSTKMIVNDPKGNLMYKVYSTHGRLGVNSTADDPIRRNANMRLAIKRKLQGKAGDCVLMACAHAHKLLVSEPEKELFLTDDGERVKSSYTKARAVDTYLDPSLRYYCCTGSFLKTFIEGASTYSEMAMYDPTEIGYIEAFCENKEIVNVQKVII